MNLRVLAAVLAGLLVAASLQGRAETGFPILLDYVVDTTADPTPDNSCTTDPASECSLREAIIEANTTLGDVDAHIVLPDLGAPGPDTFELEIADVSGDEDAAATGDLDIFEDISFFGQGKTQTIIDANSLGRAFDINGAFFVVFDGVQIKGGAVTDAYGGGIFSLDGKITLRDAAVKGNKLTNTDNIIDSGAGIAILRGSLRLEDSLVSQNTAQDCTSPPCVEPGRTFGGGIYNGSGAVIALGSTIRANHASDGGGIYANRFPGETVNPNTRLVDSIVDGNTARLFGGGIVNRGDQSTLTLLRTIVSGNSADIGSSDGLDGEGIVRIAGSSIRGHDGIGLNLGGATTITDTTINANGVGFVVSCSCAIAKLERVTVSGNSDYGIRTTSSSETTIINSTISGNGNTLTSGAGSGIRNDGDLVVQSSTITGNKALGFAGGIRNEGEVSLLNTIVANNKLSSGDCGNFNGGTLDSLGYNLDSDDSCSLDRPSDKPGVDPMLGSLADNGGATRTHALLTGSPAIDTGPPSCPPPETDQRKVSRPRNGTPAGDPRCDRGAFERKSAGVP
ncbi:MAG: choice-of-anchor Q domain-containing protein [Dehalococcoidia bacterium]